MFEELTGRLGGVFRKLSGDVRLTEDSIQEAMREVRMALLEADVNYKVAKAFTARVSELATGQKVWDSLTPEQQAIESRNMEIYASMIEYVDQEIGDFSMMMGSEQRSLTETELLNRDYYRGRFGSKVGDQVIYNWDERPV